MQGGVCLMCTASKGLSRVLSTGEVPNEACRKKKCTSQKRKVLTDSSKVKKKDETQIHDKRKLKRRKSKTEDQMCR